MGVFQEETREATEEPPKSPDRNASTMKSNLEHQFQPQRRRSDSFLDCGRAKRRDTVQISHLGLAAAAQGPKQGPLNLTHSTNMFIFNLFFINEVQIFRFCLPWVPPARLFSLITAWCHLVLGPSRWISILPVSSLFCARVFGDVMHFSCVPNSLSVTWVCSSRCWFKLSQPEFPVVQSLWFWRCYFDLVSPL